MSKRSVLSVAVALALPSLAFAQSQSQYSNVVFFGDSLTDSGYYAPITQGKMGLSESGKFTTNPDLVWSQILANKLGTTATPNIPYAGQSGNNYAIGGARAGVDKINSSFGVPINAVTTQVDSYLPNIDTDALHVVWVGANDLFAAQIEKDSAKAASILLGAVDSAVSAVDSLHQAGAKYIVLGNIPDVGLTPDVLGTSAQSTATATANLYNTLLLQKARATGANIIPLDTFSLLQEVAANPSVYGITNMTDKACGTTNSLLCGSSVYGDKNSTYFFADDVHPTGVAHQMIADYAYATITAPSDMASLPYVASKQTLSMTIDGVQSHLATGTSVLADAPAKGTVKPWVSVMTQSATVSDWESDKALGVLAGVDYRPTYINGVVGLYVNANGADYDHKQANLETTIKDRGFGVYHATHFDKLGIDTSIQLGAGRIDMDSTRQLSLGNYQTAYDASTKGKRYHASVLAQRPIALQNLSLTPYLGASAMRVKLDGLRENSDSATALGFDEQRFDSVYGKVGLGASYPIKSNVRVFGDVYYQDLLSSDGGDVSASVNSLPSVRFSTPMGEVDESAVGASLGVKATLGKLDVKATVSHAQGDDDKATQVGVSLAMVF